MRYCKLPMLTASAGLGLALLFAPPVLAQTTTTTGEEGTRTTIQGAPQQGVEAPGRFRNPSDSRQLLEDRPAQRRQEPAEAGGRERETSNPYRRALERYREGDEEEAGQEEGTRARPQFGFRGAPSIAPIDVTYAGVTPGMRDEVEHIARRANELTWLGFQPLEGRTRVFIQTGGEARYTVFDEGGTLRIVLQGTQVNDRNLRRHVDTRYFGRAVHGIQARPHGAQATEIVIQRRADRSFTVERDGNYIYVDFAERAER